MSLSTNPASADVAAVLAASPKFASLIVEAESLSGVERVHAVKRIATGFFAKRVVEYIAAGGRLADELKQHLPANDATPPETATLSTRPADIRVGSQKAPSRIAAAASSEAAEADPEKWIKPKAPKNYTLMHFTSVAHAMTFIDEFSDVGDAASQIAFSIGWSKVPSGFTELDIDKLASQLAEKIASTQTKVKKLIAKGVWKISESAEETQRNAARGAGFEFLEGTQYTLSADKALIGVLEKRGETQEFSAICSAFFALGKVRDENSGSWGLRIAFNDFDGERHETTIGAADLHGDPRALRARLADEGFQIVPYARHTLERLFSDIMPRVKNTLTTFTRPGWHDSRYATVLGEVIGEDAGSAVLSDRTGAEDREKKGTLEDWKAASNELAKLNDHWAISEAAAFAGILIDFCGLETAAACLAGPTSDGKTIGLTMAASAHGNPKERASVFQPARTTANGLEAQFERCSGATIAVDELALADPREVGAMLMLLASGSGKARMTKASALQRTARWRCFVLFSSERSLRNIVEGAKGQYLGGHAVRCVDVATTGARRHDPSVIRALAQKLKENYGHAAPIFAERLSHADASKVRERIAREAKALAGDDASPAQTRAAHTFAVLIVAAQFAEGAKLIANADATRIAITRAWDRYAAGDELKAANPVAEALEKLADYVATNRNHTILPLPKKAEERADAWRGVDEEPEERLQHRQAWGYYDDATIFIAKDRIIEMAGGVVKFDDLRRGLGDNLQRRGAKDLVWQSLPGGLKLNHYRVAASFFVGDDG